MLDLLFIRKARRGEFDYYPLRKRGTVDVWHDSQRYVYRQPQAIGRTPSEMKSAIVEAFQYRGAARATVHVTGSYPSWTVETSC